MPLSADKYASENRLRVIIGAIALAIFSVGIYPVILGTGMLVDSLCRVVPDTANDIAPITKFVAPVLEVAEIKINLPREISDFPKEILDSINSLKSHLNRLQVSKNLPCIDAYLFENREDAEIWKNIWVSLTAPTSSSKYIFQFGDHSKEIFQSLFDLQSLTFLNMKEDFEEQNENDIVVPFPHASIEMTEIFLSCIERGFIGDAITDKNMLEFLEISEHFEVEWMSKVCKTYIISQLNEDNVVEIYHLFPGKTFVDDPLAEKCLSMMIERFKNPLHFQELINQFDPKNHFFLEKFFKETPPAEYPATIELLSLFLPKIINGPEISTINESFFSEQIIAYRKKIAGATVAVTHQQFLSAFKKMCPSSGFMSVDERLQLFKSFIDLSIWDFDNHIKILCSSESPKFLKDEQAQEFIKSYRKLFSLLIYHYSMDGIQKILEEIYDEKVEADERKELLFVLGEMSKISDSFSYSESKSTSPLPKIFQMPRGQREELIKIANSWLHEEMDFVDDYKKGKLLDHSTTNMDLFLKFFSYREQLLNTLVNIPEEHRKAYEMEFRKSQKVQNLIPAQVAL